MDGIKLRVGEWLPVGLGDGVKVDVVLGEKERERLLVSGRERVWVGL